MKKLFCTLITLNAIISYAKTNTNFLPSANNQNIIVAHTHTFQQNILHQSYCNQIGGVDITDNSDVYLGKNTLDATFCKITDDVKYKSMMAYASAGSFNSDDTLLMLSRSFLDKNAVSSNGTWRSEAANATVPLGSLWWVRGAGYFNNIEHSSVSININVPDFGCSASNGNSNFTGSGQYTAQVTCAATMGRRSTVDIATACVNGSCVEARGTIYFQ
jgi:hypothetical protein